MALPKQKIIQSLVQAIIEIDSHVARANTIAQAVKTNYQALGIDPSGTGLTAGQITAINAYFTDIQALVDHAIPAVAKSKDVPSHSAEVLK